MESSARPPATAAERRRFPATRGLGFLEDDLQSGVAALYLKSAPDISGPPGDSPDPRTECMAPSGDAGVAQG